MRFYEDIVRPHALELAWKAIPQNLKKIYLMKAARALDPKIPEPTVQRWAVREQKESEQ